MHFQTLSLALLTGVATLASAKTIVITAKSSLVFDPESVTAAQGDILEFHFEPANHSVAMGEFGSINGPCVPANNGGFFSGFMPTSSGESDKVFRVTINNTDPIVFYCTQVRPYHSTLSQHPRANQINQGRHCAQGMIGVVNPSGDNNLAAYKARASGLGQSVSPPAVFGGVIADRGSSTGSGDASASPSSPPGSSPTGDQKDGAVRADVAGKALLALAVGVASWLALM